MFQAPKLTNAGKALYYDNIGGQGITFTTIKLGKGTLTQSIALLTDLVDTVVTIDASLSSGGEKTYVDISGAFSNAGLTEGFYWKEIGVFAADPDYPDDRTRDILFCYQNAYDTADFIPAASVETVEKHITVPLIVGDATNVSCLIDSSLVYATMKDIRDHNASPSSHADIRLAITELEEAVSEVQQAVGDVDEEIKAHNDSADAHSVLFSQKAAAADLKAHTENTTVHITASERTSWNNKVDKASGTLSFTLGRDAGGVYVEY